MLASGNLLTALQDRASGTANQAYGTLAAEPDRAERVGLTAASQTAGAYNNLANLYQQTAGQRLDFDNSITHGRMGANNQYAQGGEGERRPAYANLGQTLGTLAGKAIPFPASAADGGRALSPPPAPSAFPSQSSSSQHRVPHMATYDFSLPSVNIPAPQGGLISGFAGEVGNRLDNRNAANAYQSAARQHLWPPTRLRPAGYLARLFGGAQPAPTAGAVPGAGGIGSDAVASARASAAPQAQVNIGAAQHAAARGAGGAAGQSADAGLRQQSAGAVAWRSMGGGQGWGGGAGAVPGGISARTRGGRRRLWRARACRCTGRHSIRGQYLSAAAAAAQSAPWRCAVRAREPAAWHGGRRGRRRADAGPAIQCGRDPGRTDRRPERRALPQISRWLRAECRSMPYDRLPYDPRLGYDPNSVAGYEELPPIFVTPDPEPAPPAGWQSLAGRHVRPEPAVPARGRRRLHTAAGRARAARLGVRWRGLSRAECRPGRRRSQ